MNDEELRIVASQKEKRRELQIIARRDHIMFLDRCSRNMDNSGNYSTGGIVTDAQVEQHRKFARGLLIESEEVSITTLAKRHDLTVEQVRVIIYNARYRVGSDKPRPAPNRRPKEDIEREHEENAHKRDACRSARPSFAACEDLWT